MLKFESAQRTGYKSAQPPPAQSSHSLDKSSEWSYAESPAQSLHSEAQSLENLSTIDDQTPAVVSKSTSSIFSNFLPNITILIARANSTNSTDITQEKATSLASTLSSIPSLKGISKNLNSPDSIKLIIVKSTPTVKSPGEQTDEPPSPFNPPHPPQPPNSFASSVQASLGSSSNTAQAQATTMEPPVSRRNQARAPLGSRRNQAGRHLFEDDTDVDDDAASYGKGKSFTNRRQDATPSHTGPGDLYAAQQRQQQNAHLPPAVAASRAAGADAAIAAAQVQTSRADAGARASRAAGAAGAAGDQTMTSVPHEQSFMGETFVRQFSTGSAPPGTTPNVKSTFWFPPPPPSFTPSALKPEPPFTQPRYNYVDLTKGSHPGGGY
uniref:Uncharacterized protein n=1 Tax=viral metagenome TaxID=1070528 RepID=A0A6C0EWE2_9ZZZZ